MTGNVYVVCDPGLEYSKLGFSRKLSSRRAGLATNSSAPFKWRPWKVYHLEDEAIARKLERLAYGDPQLASCRIAGKREFFKCRPTLVTAAIERQAAMQKIDVVRGVPYFLEGVKNLFGQFPSLPKEVLDTMDRAAQEAYWIGFRDALFALRYLDGIKLRAADVVAISQMLQTNALNNEPSGWKTIFAHYLGGDSDNRAIAERAAVLAQRDERIAFEDWQNDH